MRHAGVCRELCSWRGMAGALPGRQRRPSLRPVPAPSAHSRRRPGTGQPVWYKRCPGCLSRASGIRSCLLAGLRRKTANGESLCDSGAPWQSGRSRPAALTRCGQIIRRWWMPPLACARRCVRGRRRKALGFRSSRSPSAFATQWLQLRPAPSAAHARPPSPGLSSMCGSVLRDWGPALAPCFAKTGRRRWWNRCDLPSSPSS